MSGRHTVRALGPSILPLMSRRSAGPDLRAFIAAARRGVLATIDPDDMPRLVPICYVLATEPQGDSLVLYSALDEKPKRVGDPLALARVRDLLARPAAAVLVDRWSEDWQRLGWVRLACRGDILAPEGDGTGDARGSPRSGEGATGLSATGDEHTRAVAALRAKYPQYRGQRLERRPLIRLTCSVASSWEAVEEET